VGGPLRIGVVGAGAISAQYSATLLGLPQLRLTAVADLNGERAKALAARHPGARVLSLDRLLRADDVDLVLNLTTPAGHAGIAQAALAAGKHVYSEKPLATSMADAEAMLSVAAAAERRLGCAPDTVLGTGVATARAAVDDGLIGVPHAATAFMVTPGHERWHPDPEFYYRPGGGPLLDMGPYYVTALVHLLGPVRRVLGASSRPRAQRVIGQGPRAGMTFDATIDTHLTGVLEHESGALTTLMMSFDTWAGRLPRIEVYGRDGSLSVPDPNTFAGDIEIWTAAEPAWRVLPVAAGYAGAGRGIGIADLAAAIGEHRPHRAGAELALHVLDVMLCLQQAADSGTAVRVGTSCRRPDPVPGVIPTSPVVVPPGP